MTRKKMMRSVGMLILLVSALACLSGCLKKVEAGHVGVKVYLLGGSKGVDNEILGVGRYWIGWNEELYLFPVFQQTAQWSFDRHGDESITFQTKEGLSVNADVGISYKINPDKVAVLFQTYRKGINEITDVYLKQVVRDAFVQVSSTRAISSIYGEGKAELIKAVRDMVSEKMEPYGIMIDYVSIIGDLRLPENIVAAINAKIQATQMAEQRENELAQAKAEADKLAAEADGKRRAMVTAAQGEAEAILTMAKAQADANIILAKSITPDLIRYQAVEKWNGQVPTYAGGNAGLVPFIDVTGK
ncbi:prohibitin family protein [Desulfosarcina sp. OttesenSCG-928-B08]|nr:prohibitin family protein [Desulfosarcina sp. OttesenSCG-928-B08]